MTSSGPRSIDRLSKSQRLRSRVGCVRDEAGQAIVLIAVAALVVVGIAGIVIDIGYAYYTQRSLQASADAAALAGAQELPDPAAAAAVARQYGANPGGKNERFNIEDVATSVTTRCLTSAPGCEPVNAVVVKEAVEVDTLFGRVLGIDSYDVEVRSTACSPCAAKPLDIMLVLDRTGSMCQDSSGANDPACTDLNKARNGLRTFLILMDPSLQSVGFAVFPPATSLGTKCSTPATSNYNSTSSKYVIVPLSTDYKNGQSLNNSSNLVSTINCQKGGGRTAYANAIEHSQAELDARGRPDVQDVIVFFSDGAANIGPTYYSTTSPYRRRPCRQGVTSAAAQKARGTLIFSIGFALEDDTGGCQSYTGAAESPAITVHQALSQIASAPEYFYVEPSEGDLTAVYKKVAADISRPAAKLVDNDTP